MFLVVGTLLLAVGLIIVFQLTLFHRLPKAFSYAVIFITAGLLLFTKTVHGIWLGLSIVILGVLWIKFFLKNNRQIKAE